MVELDDRDREVLEVLGEGRANPKLIRERTGLDRGDTNTVLVRLSRENLVEQQARGLYEITEKGRAELGLSVVNLDKKTLDHARQALDELEAALERGDRDRVRALLEQARAALEDGDVGE